MNVTAQALLAIAGAIAAVGIIWRGAIKPILGFFRRFRDLLTEIREALHEIKYISSEWVRDVETRLAALEAVVKIKHPDLSNHD